MGPTVFRHWRGLLALPALVAACSGERGATTEPPETTTTTTFAALQTEIFDKSCATSGCHAGASAAAGLSLEAGKSYTQLVGALPTHATARRDGMRRVMAFKPDSSLLYHKLVAEVGHHAADYGALMPVGRPLLSRGQVEFVRAWIGAGAPRDRVVADAELLRNTTPQGGTFTPLAAPPAGQGVQLRIEPFTVRSDFERELFVYRTLGNAEPLYVTRIETRMRPFSHHLLLYTFKANAPTQLLRVGEVRDLRNDDGTLNPFTALSMGYHVYLAGSQTPESRYDFPQGVALRLPANVGIDLNAHYVNKTGATITGEAYANLWTVPVSQVQKVASTLDWGNTSFSLPPGRRTTVEKTFTVSRQTSVFSLSSHMHARGERFEIRIVGGARDGELVYENTSWEHPQVRNYAQPIVLEPGQGLRSVITYNNTTTRTIGFGLTSEDEMGIIFGYYY